MREIVKRYGNGEVTVVWKPSLCIHSARCFRGLPEVFDPRARPWVNIGGAGTEAIVRQVDQCPSGALSYVRAADAQPPGAVDAARAVSATERTEEHAEARVQPLPNGPLLVTGDLLVERADGSLERRYETTAFCRCGGSANKPYCDGTHARNGFRG